MRIHYKGDEIDGYRPRKAPHQMSDTAPIEHPSWLTTGDFTAADEPLRLFTAWLDRGDGAPNRRDPTAMTLATVDSAGLPNARMVLLKGVDERGFVFYTNMDSQKGQELDAQPLAALVFYWKSVNRQVRVRGPSIVSLTPRPTPISPPAPSRRRSAPGRASNRAPLESRLAFEKAVALYAAKYAIGDVPRPPNWSGYRIVPISIEFWQERAFRLHDRVEFKRDHPDDPWTKTRLYP